MNKLFSHYKEFPCLRIRALLRLSGEQGLETKIFISNEKGLHLGGRMDLITVIEDLQALLVLVIFLLIIAVGFKVWAWNYSVPHK
jgi:hypothetical protein